MTARTARTLSAACLAACAAGLFGCAPPRVAPPPAEAPRSVKAQPQKLAETPSPAPQAAPERPAPKPAPKRKPPPRKKPAPPPPPVVQVAPPPAPPQPSPEEVRGRARDAYLAALQKAVVAFNAPSPVTVDQRFAAQLTVDPPKELAQLAEELRKSLPDPAWRPAMRAQLVGPDFEIAPAKESAVKELSLSGRTEWSWSITPKLPGTKRLTARVAIMLPAGLGEPRELPALARTVEVEATLAWRAGNLWDEYRLWILAALAVVIAAIAWRRIRRPA